MWGVDFRTNLSFFLPYPPYIHVEQRNHIRNPQLEVFQHATQSFIY
jgi:hypothetical protein